MMSEKEKMEKGMWYDANYDPELFALRKRAQAKALKLSAMPHDQFEERNKAIKELLGYMPEEFDLVTPFMVDYGINIHIGKSVFINANCYFMDCANITIGEHTFIGPYCGLYTATHPLSYKQRNKGLEKALPITIGKNCWLGGNVSIMPGVTIGDGCVIAAGAVVNRDVEENCLVAGVPAKVIRKIDQNELL